MGALFSASPTDLMMSAPAHNTIGPAGPQPGSSHGEQQASNQSQSGQYFQNPGQVNQFSGAMVDPINNASSNYMNFINNPTAHPYFTNALSGLLQALVPSENNARLNLNDQFRAAGNTSSSTYGHNAMGLEAELNRNRMQTASQLLTTLFPQVTQAMFAPMGQADSLINALKMNQQTASGQSSGSTQNQGNPNANQIQQFTGVQSSNGPGNVFQTPQIQNSPYGVRSAPTPAGNNTGPYISPDLTSFDWGNTPDAWSDSQPQDMSGWY